MKAPTTFSLLFLGSLAKSVWADVPIYGQCGGVGWTGQTTCASGGACVKQNDWYSQCLPGTGVPSTTTVVPPTSTTVVPSTTVSPTTSPTAPAPPSGTIITLPLGDSITFGMGTNDGNAYRKYLKDRLAQDGIIIDYIGSVKNGNMPDNDNEGHSGATITQISGYATTPLSQKPQVVTLMAGTNDVAQNSDLANAPNRLVQLIDKIFAASPDATVLVASLIPLSFGQANVDTYNSRIQTLIQNKITAGQRLVFVSMSSLTTADLADGVHPNANGYQKMGQAWYTGWTAAAQKGWIV